MCFLSLMMKDRNWGNLTTAIWLFLNLFEVLDYKEWLKSEIVLFHICTRSYPKMITGPMSRKQWKEKPNWLWKKGAMDSRAVKRERNCDKCKKNNRCFITYACWLMTKHYNSCKRKSYETICENIVSTYQTLVFSLPRMTTFWHRRPKTHFMTGLAGQPSNINAIKVLLLSKAGLIVCLLGFVVEKSLAYGRLRFRKFSTSPCLRNNTLGIQPFEST